MLIISKATSRNWNVIISQSPKKRGGFSSLLHQSVIGSINNNKVEFISFPNSHGLTVLAVLGGAFTHIKPQYSHQQNTNQIQRITFTFFNLFHYNQNKVLINFFHMKKKDLNMTKMVIIKRALTVCGQFYKVMEINYIRQIIKYT